MATGVAETFWGASSPLCWFSNKELLCITHTVEHNYISSSSTVGIQLHVSALYVGHLQVVTWLSEQLYKMCGVFFLVIRGWVWGTRSRCFSGGYHDLGHGNYNWNNEISFYPPNPQYPKRTPHTSFIAAVWVKLQPEDGPHIGRKHVVVFLLYY